MKTKKRLSNGEIKIYEYEKYSIKKRGRKEEFDKYDLAYIKAYEQWSLNNK